MSTLGDLINEQFKKRRKELENGNENAEAMSPEDQAAQEEEKNKHWTMIKKYLGY